MRKLFIVSLILVSCGVSHAMTSSGGVSNVAITVYGSGLAASTGAVVDSLYDQVQASFTVVDNLLAIRLSSGSIVNAGGSVKFGGGVNMSTWTYSSAGLVMALGQNFTVSTVTVSSLMILSTGTAANTTATPTLGAAFPGSGTDPFTWVNILIKDAAGNLVPACMPVWKKLN